MRAQPLPGAAEVTEILGTHICDGEHGRHWSDGLVDYQEGESIEYWVSEIFGCDSIEPIVGAVLPGSERDYLTTQVIAEYLATHCKPRIDGVIFKSVQESAGSNIVLFSHVACAATSTVGRIRNGYMILGSKRSDGPCIEYVSDSLVYHSISKVK